jgi:hypothetical protein
MPNTEGFLELAGIGGVFVGFAALIAVRSGDASGLDVGYMRGVVTIGMLSIVAALAPVTVVRYEVTEHEVWALSSVVALVGGLVLFGAMARTPEYRTNWRSEMQEARARPAASRVWAAIGLTAYVLFMTAVTLAPIVILAGAAPESEGAIYFTVVVLLLLGAGWALLDLVFSRRDQESSRGHSSSQHERGR